jgi:ribosome-binding factor A
MLRFETLRMPSRRQRRVAELIHRELSLLLLHGVKDPRLAGVTITGVDVTRDLLLARIYFTVFEAEDGGKEALTGLEHAKGYLRTQLAERVELRFVPDLIFALDRSAQYGQRIDALLDQIKESSPRGDEHEPE